MPTSANKHTDFKTITTVVFLLLMVLLKDAKSTFHKFQGIDNARLNGPVGDVGTARSQIECCYLCVTARTINCTGSNFRPHDRHCELVTGSEFTVQPNNWWILNIRLSCETDWIQFGTFCYKFVTSGKSWTEALSSCEDMGGSLASLSTPARFDFVTSQLTTTSFSLAWIGARDTLGTLEDNRWMDGTPLGADNPRWRPDEPNNVVEQCVELRYIGDEFLLVDTSCGQTKPYLCEEILQ